MTADYDAKGKGPCSVTAQQRPAVGKATAAEAAWSSIIACPPVRLPNAATTLHTTHSIMAFSIEQSPFFLQQKSRGEIIVKGMKPIETVSWGQTC